MQDMRAIIAAIGALCVVLLMIKMRKLQDVSDEEKECVAQRGKTGIAIGLTAGALLTLVQGIPDVYAMGVSVLMGMTIGLYWKK